MLNVLIVGVVKINVLILEDDEPQEIWDAIHTLQLIFHPRYAPEGKFVFSEFFELRRSKEVMILFDRNLLSSLLKLSEQGFLKDEKEMRTIALIMTWALMNQFPISAGLAIKENAVKVKSSSFAKIELKRFNEIFDYYPSMVWLRLAQGAIDKIPPCKFSDVPFDTEIAYHSEDDHFLMHMACMLHIVYLYKQNNLSSATKVFSFLEWNFKYLLIGQYTLTYIAMLFTNQEGMRAPKGANSNDINVILKGCYNQAWDLNYLTNWSSYYWDDATMNEVFLFATADVMLKRIFINTHGDGDFLDIINTIFSKKDAWRIIDYYTQKASPENRIKPDFGENPTQYFHNLIQQEKDRLSEHIAEIQ